MSVDHLGAAVTRLHDAAGQAGIDLTDEELARIASAPYFGNAEALRRLIARFPADTLPDFLRESFQPGRDIVTGGAS